MNFSYFEENVLSALRGQFSTEQFGARLFMFHEDIQTPENFLVWFHERFHYLQSIFTPYGHLKWGAYRTTTSDIISAWRELPDKLKCSRKIPIAEYIEDRSPESIKIAGNIWFRNIPYQLYSAIEQDATNIDLFNILSSINRDDISPEIELMGEKYRFKGIDVFESFAKFEESIMAELILGKSLDESIDPSILNPEYYSALYYFISQVGVERLKEFPVACELALTTPHIPSPIKLKTFQDNAPNWRFVKIIDVLKTDPNLPSLDYNDDKSFYVYSNTVLTACGYDTLDGIWNSAEAYALQADLSMAKEMKSAIDYKKAHPWMLSYPMCKPEFLSDEFNRFVPYYTITEDGVMYNIENVSLLEIMFENNYQAIAAQISGRVSNYCCDRHKMMCGDAYMRTEICPQYRSGECNGYIDKDSLLPEIKLDESGNVEQGCFLEMILNSMGTSIKNIDIGLIRPLHYNQLLSVIKAVHGEEI